MRSARLLVATDVRLRRDHAGNLLSTHPAALHETFEPLARVYRSVDIFARTAPAAMPTVGAAGGPGIEATLVPDFASVNGLVSGLPRTLWRAWREVGRHDVVMGRLPEPLSLVVGWAAVLRRRPFVANVVADPTNPRLGLGAAARLANRAVVAATRALVRRSAATIYVTESYLQKLCPPPPRPTLTRSNVRVDDAWFTAPRRGGAARTPRVVLVGSNQSWDKGQLVLLDAAALLAREGLPVDLTFVGGGRHVEDLPAEAARRHPTGRVDVLGQVESRARLAEVLDSHDVFCLPSLSEGLPRAMVEAMARGLPAVGSTVGGIPELLPADALCPPGDVIALAAALRNVLEDPHAERRSTAAVATARRVAHQADPMTLVEFLRGFEQDRRTRR